MQGKRSTLQFSVLQQHLQEDKCRHKEPVMFYSEKIFIQWIESRQSHVFHLNYSCAQPQLHSKSYNDELLLSSSLSSKLPTNLWQMQNIKISSAGECSKEVTWTIHLLLLILSPKSYKQHHTSYHPVNPYIGKSWSHGLFSSWSCCTMLDTWASPGLLSPASGLQNYSGSKTSSTFPEASFSPQSRQKQLVTQQHKKWNLKVLLEAIKNWSYQISKYSWVMTGYNSLKCNNSANIKFQPLYERKLIRT